MAKSLLETDRCVWAGENGYTTRLCRMEPLEASPKNDIIIGWRKDSPPPEAHVEALSRPVLVCTVIEPCVTEEEGRLPKRVKTQQVSNNVPVTEAEPGTTATLAPDVLSTLSKDYNSDEIGAVHRELLDFLAKPQVKSLDFPLGISLTSILIEGKKPSFSSRSG